jgi:hypothetical protein
MIGARQQVDESVRELTADHIEEMGLLSRA